MSKTLRALVEAWDLETYPGPFQVEPRYRRDAWWADNKMGDSIQITPKDVDLIVNALPALLDVAEAGSYYRRCVTEGFDESTTLEAWAVFDTALDRLDGAS
jgi:hypothetical protein